MVDTDKMLYFFFFVLIKYSVCIVKGIVVVMSFAQCTVPPVGGEEWVGGGVRFMTDGCQNRARKQTKKRGRVVSY